MGQGPWIAKEGGNMKEFGRSTISLGRDVCTPDGVKVPGKYPWRKVEMHLRGMEP